MYPQFNGDTGANYNNELIYGLNSSTGAQVNTATATAGCGFVAVSGSPSNMPASTEITFFDYARTVWNKTWTAVSQRLDNTGTVFAGTYSGNWNNTAAISSIVIGTIDGSNFSIGSVFSLYGIS
jgi:hypothetical protein